MDDRPRQNDPLAALSKRERMIAERFAEGLTHRQIGEALFIAPSTVRTHIAAIYRKLEIGNKAALVRLWAARENSHAQHDGESALVEGAELALAPGPGAESGGQQADAGRRQLTVLAGELRGLFRLSQETDPEDLRDLTAAFDNLCREVIARFDGFTASVSGGAVRALFGYPSAHEDDAERAVRAGLELVATVAQTGGRLGRPVQLAVGIATGQVVVDDPVAANSSEPAVVGGTPQLAARLQGLAHPGQIVIAEATQRLVGDGFAFEELNAPAAEVGTGPAKAFAVTGERPTQSRFDARSGPAVLPMVGRDQELALLLDRWARAKAGEGQVVVLSGEAGIGKSRLTRALLDALEAEPHTRIRYQCSPFHTESALWPVIQQLRHAAGIASTDPTSVALDKLEALLARTGNPSAGAPLIADLLGLDGASRYGDLGLTAQARRVRTLAALNDQLPGLAAQEPVLVIMEDVHWIDPTTQELIEQSLGVLGSARILLLLTSRPEGEPRLAGAAAITLLTLNRLGRAGVEEMVSGLGGARGLDAERIETIVARTDGVPLFVEELTKAVVESGDTSIPASLQDSLMARLDRLQAVKHVAQMAAVIGRSFEHRTIAALSRRPEAELSEALDRLIAAELVFRRGVPPDATYLFKHALVQDAAYDSLLKRDRQNLHTRIAETLLQQFPTITETEPELLAHHYTEARLVEPAITNWLRAGQQAAQRAANLEAIQYLQRALDLLQTLPEDDARNTIELKVLMHLGPALMVVKGWAAPEVGTVYERANVIAGQLEKSADLFPPLVGIWLYQNARGRYDLADALAEQLFHVAKATSDPEMLLQAHHAAWPIPMYRGRFESSNEHIDKGLALYDHDRHKHHALVYMGHDPAVCAHACGAQVAWALGLPDRAKRHGVHALELARRLGHPPTVAFALWYISGASAARGDVTAVLSATEELSALSQEQKLVQIEASAQFLGGWALALTGQVKDGLERMRVGFASWNRIGPRSWLQVFTSLYVDGLLHGRRYAEALEALDEGLAFSEQTGERWWLSRIHHLRGEALLHSGNTVAAAASLELAIQVARAQKAKSWELRASMRLAQLRAEQGGREDARSLLAPIYSWFTEGLDTADLREAKALLDALR